MASKRRLVRLLESNENRLVLACFIRTVNTLMSQAYKIATAAAVGAGRGGGGGGGGRMAYDACKYGGGPASPDGPGSPGNPARCTL